MGWGGSRGRLVPAHVDQHLLLHLGHSNGERGTLDYAKVAVALRGANSVGCSQAPQGTYANMGGHIVVPTSSSLLSLHGQWLLRRGKCHELRDREMGVRAEMRQK